MHILLNLFSEILVFLIFFLLHISVTPSKNRSLFKFLVLNESLASCTSIRKKRVTGSFFFFQN